MIALDIDRMVQSFLALVRIDSVMYEERAIIERLAAKSSSVEESDRRSGRDDKRRRVGYRYGTVSEMGSFTSNRLAGHAAKLPRARPLSGRARQDLVRHLRCRPLKHVG